MDHEDWQFHLPLLQHFGLALGILLVAVLLRLDEIRADTSTNAQRRLSGAAMGGYGAYLLTKLVCAFYGGSVLVFLGSIALTSSGWASAPAAVHFIIRAPLVITALQAVGMLGCLIGLGVPQNLVRRLQGRPPRAYVSDVLGAAIPRDEQDGRPAG